MPIVVKLDDMLHARRMTLTELAERIGITLANLSILKTGKARAVRFSTLEAICDVMQCQPGDLLEYAPPAAEEAATVPDRANASAAARLPLTRPLNTVPEEA
jgi:putative transcriptional regulator